ncbi:uncharacterized protein V6R79_003453 [Siganus canaliculatus]
MPRTSTGGMAVGGNYILLLLVSVCFRTSFTDEVDGFMLPVAGDEDVSGCFKDEDGALRPEDEDESDCESLMGLNDFQWTHRPLTFNLLPQTGRILPLLLTAQPHLNALPHMCHNYE